jgi:ceroid-lipofuscinosis MFS transporter 7
MPSLWHYLESLRSDRDFYAWVVAIYSVGQAIGSVAIGTLSNRIGTKNSLLLCFSLSLCASCAYALAGPIFVMWTDRTHDPACANAASWAVLFSRLLQGVGSGGAQAVEQAYISIATPPSRRTELTGRLSTMAVLGFIFGPTCGALVAQVPTFYFGVLRIDSFSAQGWAMAAINMVMLCQTSYFRELERTRSGKNSIGATPARTGTAGAASKPVPSQAIGVWACIGFFAVYFSGFAIQETITTPLVQSWFGWNATAANMLFIAAGLLNLVCAVGLSVASAPRQGAHGPAPRVGDRSLLLCSLGCAALGWALLTLPPSRPQFILAFTLVTIAFPYGRGVCLAMVSKLLGDTPQGAWMGLTFAMGAMARILGPFWAVYGFFQFGAAAVFGSTAALFCTALLAMAAFWRRLSPAVGCLE